MPRCAFTGEEIPPGTGKMFIRKDGKVLYFKNRRAEKNYLVLKRNPRRVRYTAAARQSKQQHMAELQHEREHAGRTTAEKRSPAKKKAVKTVKGVPGKRTAKEVE